MKKVLKITSSVFNAGTETGVSTQLSNGLLAGLRELANETGVQLDVVERDLALTAIPHLDPAWIQALTTQKQERTAEQVAMVQFSDTLIAEVQAADILLIAAPMYNFTVPSTLKAWIDHIARAGVTFKYTEYGPVGLLENKKVFLIVTSGGQHEEGVTDFVRPYLKTALGLLGLKDIEIISASGLNLGAGPRANALLEAEQATAAVLAGAAGLFADNESAEQLQGGAA
ncbi:MAG: NAD(P)H-dependent oxidoreductase [Pseudomonadales bacterium]|nr:NAD(P)H-dependent oxidoreductase [Pseudomonadales bacterium]